MELVEVLVEFENSWSQGLTYFIDKEKRQQLMHFSQVIEATADKHKKFAEQVEARDMEIFFYIPSLLILISLDEDDKNICRYFYPNLYEKETKTGA